MERRQCTTNRVVDIGQFIAQIPFQEEVSILMLIHTIVVAHRF